MKLVLKKVRTTPYRPTTREEASESDINGINKESITIQRPMAIKVLNIFESHAAIQFEAVTQINPTPPPNMNKESNTNPKNINGY